MPLNFVHWTFEHVCLNDDMIQTSLVVFSVSFTCPFAVFYLGDQNGANLKDLIIGAL